MTRQINKTHETGEWSMNFNEITKIALKKKPKDAKCSDHRTYSTDSSEDTLEE
jgi:hypothetical protein